MRGNVQKLADQLLGRGEHTRCLEGWAKNTIRSPEWAKSYTDWRIIHDMLQLASEVLKEADAG